MFLAAVEESLVEGSAGGPGGADVDYGIPESHQG